MADLTMIARLAGFREFEELKTEFAERREEEIQALARKTFANPEDHDRLEWERKKAFYAGVDAVLALPIKAQANLFKRKESQ